MSSNVKSLFVCRYKPDCDSYTSYLTEEQGWRAWLTTVDHKKIGILYFFVILLFFFLGGLFAVLLRTELLVPVEILFNADQYNRLFTLHGAAMVFFVLIPSIPAVFGNFFLPIHLGAKDVAFPRLNLLSYYVFIVGVIFTLFSILTGAVDTGWTFYTPYSSSASGSIVSITLGVFILGFSSILTGLNFIVTIHKMRGPGLTWSKLSLFTWSLYATSIIQLLATPVLAITVLLLAMENILGIGIFDPALGGDPLLFQHFFWFYSHPAVYIMIVPAFGVVSEVVTTFCRRNIYGYWAIAMSSLAIAFIGFLVWGHHMYTSGQSELSSAVFSFLTFLVGIPTGIKIFNWVATMHKGTISIKSPFLYILSFFFLFIIGGVTGIMLGALSVDVHLHDTYYVVAHFHYVMMGGALMAFLSAIHYWWPKVTGYLYSETLANIACGLVFVGFNLTFIPQFIMGSLGMPRRYYTYLEEFQSFHVTSTIGAYILLIGFILVGCYLFMSLKQKVKSGVNPWNSYAREWQVSSPPPLHNFDYTPVFIHGPYDYHKPIEDFQLGLKNEKKH